MPIKRTSLKFWAQKRPGMSLGAFIRLTTQLQNKSDVNAAMAHHNLMMSNVDAKFPSWVVRGSLGFC